jgi:hypothetical protein
MEKALFPLLGILLWQSAIISNPLLSRQKCRHYSDISFHLAKNQIQPSRKMSVDEDL